MKKLAYLEGPTGIAGDMCLGALIHAGVPLEYLTEQLNRLEIANEYDLKAELVHRNGLQATKVHVELKNSLSNQTAEDGADLHHTFHYPPLERHPTQLEVEPGSPSRHSHHHVPSPHTGAHRHLPEIEHLIARAKLPSRAEAWSLAVFRQLAAAEGAVHGIAPEQVHFHEVGATDAIVDIVGTCLGLDWLGIDQLYCSALPTGGGTVRAAHGQLPVPTPAVLKLWELHQVPIYSNGINRELVTPTGAAIAVTLATRFGPPPAMTVQRVGLGAGSRNLPIPNILRLWLGEGEGLEARNQSLAAELPGVAGDSASPGDTLEETVVVLETQVDDLNPQALGYLYEVLFQAGALDVFTQPVGMKKSRPGVLVTVICHPETVADCETGLFRETSTLGIRRSVQQRTILRREIQSVQTDYGVVKVKIAWDPRGAIANVQPEYEDCAQIARQHLLPWRQVHQLVLQAWFLQQKNQARQSVLS